jgi:hypothetical protein
MRAKTIHVLPKDDGWTVQREDSAHRPTVYPTQKKALLAARALLKRETSGQIVLHRRDGLFTRKDVKGLPPVPSSPVKSSLGTAAIKRAISATIRESLAGG